MGIFNEKKMGLIHTRIVSRTKTDDDAKDTETPEQEIVNENTDAEPIVEKEQNENQIDSNDEDPSDDVVEEREEFKPIESNHGVEGETVGVIYGNVGTSSFECRVTSEHLERSEYVMVEHPDYGFVLCQVGTLMRKTNLSLEKSANLTDDMKIDDIVSAHIDVIGFRDNRGLLLTPRTTFKVGSEVKRADQDTVRNVLGLKINPKTDGYIGVLHGHDLPVALNINELLQRHACILAKTGGGKSYMSGDIIEELMKHDVTCMIIDPHGEYGAMRDVGKQGDSKFDVTPRGYAEKINEFSVSADPNNQIIRPLRFTFKSLEAKEILDLTRTKDVKAFLPPMKKALDQLRETPDLYSVRDLITLLEEDGSTKNALLITELEYIEEMNIFAKRGNHINELVEKGKTTVINLKGVPPDIQQLIVKRLATFLFELRKKGDIPPLMFVVEEAHNYCPQQGTVMSSKPLSTIASEGRKFGLGLMVISQRPAKIDKNVLSQCGTQIILKVTNPNDIKAIANSIEGLTNGMTDDIQSMPIGMAMVVGAGIESPLLVEVRPRESRHGGSGIKVLED